jgi:BirA family biotin operon repressor/biotin-[acetyl-CoA-carboxylase] ligase
MRIIKLDATDSTNSHLKMLYTTEPIDDYTAVSSKCQTEGRGQMGAVWESETSKNLTFSVFKEVKDFELEEPFYVSMVVSLALIKTLNSLSVPKISVKWPNDILSADKKICGVLIENVMKHGKINGTIIGIGLNVNQTVFENLPKASSLKLISGKYFDLDELMIMIINNLKDYFLLLQDKKFEELKAAYELHLFRKNKPSTFKDAEGLMFSGIIKGVSETGMLKVLLEDNLLKVFDLKQITLLY